MTEIKNAREAGEINFCIGNRTVPILEINEIDLEIQVKWDGYSKPAWIKIDILYMEEGIVRDRKSYSDILHN